MQQTKAISERRMGIAALSSLTAGLVAGIGARIIMRIVALTSYQPPSFDIGGTFNVLFFGILFGFTIGFLFNFLTTTVLASFKVSKYLSGPIRRGLITSILLLLTLFPLLLILDDDDLAHGIPLLNKIMFGALVILYGLTLGIAEKVFDHYLPREQAPTSIDISAHTTHEE